MCDMTVFPFEWHCLKLNCTVSLPKNRQFSRFCAQSQNLRIVSAAVFEGFGKTHANHVRPTYVNAPHQNLVVRVKFTPACQ